MRNKLKNNKKGIGFFSLIGVIVLILTGVLFVAVIGPYEKVKDVTDFGATITKVDLINSKIPAEEFSKREDVKNIFATGKNQYLNTLGLSNSQLLLRKQIDGNQELITCNYEGLELWYNQKNIDMNTQNNFNQVEDENIDNSDEENNENIEEGNQDQNIDNEDEQNENNENNNENENSQINSNSDKKYSSCIPNFKDDLEEDLNYYLETKLTDELTKLLRVQEIDKEPKIDVNYESSTNTLQTKVTTYYNENSRLSNILLELNYETDYNIGLFPKLVKTLSNDLPSKLSNEFKSKMPDCLKDNDYKQDYCLDKIFIDLIKKDDNDLLEFYDFKIEEITNINSEDYIGLKIIVEDKFTSKKEFEFGFILKNNIPYTLIKFDLENFQGIDNVVNVKIEKPRFYEKVSKYVILYSYKNFFDDLNNPDDYNTLLTLLQESKVPSNFERPGIFDIDNNEYFYSKINENLDLNLLLINNKITEFDIDNKEKTLAKIYQIYNPQTKQFELLKSNQELYVFVFATDKNYNYYVEEIQGKSKSITPETIFGAKELDSSNVPKISGNLALEQNSFYFQISNYQSDDFANYDIYVIEKGGTISNKCENQEENKCYYFNGNSKLTDIVQEKLIVVTSQNQIANQELYTLINTNEFSNNLFLKNGEEYEVYIVPVNKDGLGILQRTPISYELEKSINQEESSFYQIVDVNGKFKTPYLTKVIIEDQKAPDANSFRFTTASKYEITSNVLKLSWESLPQEDVVGLDAKITIKGEDMQIIEQLSRVIGTDQIVISIPQAAKQIEITQIVPIDKAGNKNSEIANQNINVIVPIG